MSTKNHPFNISEHPELISQATKCDNLANNLEGCVKKLQEILRSLPNCDCDYDCDCKYLEEEYLYGIQDVGEFVGELEFKIGNKGPTLVEPKGNDPMDWLLLVFAFGFFLGLIVAYAGNHQ